MVLNCTFSNVNVTGNFSAQTFKGAIRGSATLGFDRKYLDVQFTSFINIKMMNNNTLFFINAFQHFVYK